MWVKKDKETECHWLVLEDDNGWYRAIVKWDGCIELNRVHNIPLPITGYHPQLVDHIHYCDLDEEIKRLQSLREKAREFFGEDWNT